MTRASSTAILRLAGLIGSTASTVSVVVAGLLALLVLTAAPAAAQGARSNELSPEDPQPAAAQEPAAAGSDPIQSDLERMRVLVELLRPAVEKYEASEEPPTAAELAPLDPPSYELEAIVLRVQEWLATTGGEPPEGYRQARRLVVRILALELAWRVADLGAQADALVARDEPITEEDVAVLRRAARETQSELLELEARYQRLDTTKSGVRKVEEAKVLSETLEVLAEAEQQRETLEKLEAQPQRATEHEVKEVRSATEELQVKIEDLEDQPVVRKADEEPEGLRRARSILNTLLAGDVALTSEFVRPEIEHLESKAEPPTDAELDHLEPTLEELTNKVEVLKKSVKPKKDQPPPTRLVAGEDLLRRGALLKLRRLIADLLPVVEGYERSKAPLSPEDVKWLRGVPPQVNPVLRQATARSRYDPGVAAEPAPEVTGARDLLARVQALVPEQAAAPEEQRDSPETLPIIRAFRFYGSLRARMFVDPGGEVSFDGQTSRIGVRAEYPLSKKIKGFARGELGFNFFEATQRVFEGDPGRTDEEADSLFSPRLAFIGVETTYGRISFGKQWSAYYDVAVFSDQLPFLAAQGTGVYNAGTDGGVSGTGRADNALQYRHSIGGYKFTAQVQIRNLTDNSQPFADTWSLSATRQWNQQIYVGAAYNDVRDGVPEPAADQPKEGDRSLIVGARYEKDRIYAGGTFTVFRQHEKDDLERFYDGIGLELYCDYTWWDKLRARAALSYLEPERDHPGKFRILSLTVGASYDFTKRIRAFLLARIDASKRSDGSSADRDKLILSMFYTF